MSEVTRKSRASEPNAQQQSTADTDRTTPLRPPANIMEDAHGVTLLLEMPGVSKDRLQVHCDDKSLVVAGDIAIDLPQDMDSLYADLRTTQYRREFSLSGEQLDTTAIVAQLENGILKIGIPKREELRPRNIEVKAG
jgi:HSP20 family molecular chaperone IbpA